MIARHWLLLQDSPRVLTSQELRRAGVSRLRCVHLGKCTPEVAILKAGKVLAGKPDRATVMAHNVRLACDSGRGARWGLTQDQIARLRNGEQVTMEDSIGRFGIGYTRIE